MEAYTPVNDAWPRELPQLTRPEARVAARKLARHFGGRPRTAPRKCWIALTPPFNSIARGWRRMVHDVSHSTFNQTNVAARPHCGWHAEMEQKMAEYVIAQGWLSGSLRPASRAVAAPTTDVKLARVVAAVKRWETKRKRAETALRKLRRRVRYYERRVTA